MNPTVTCNEDTHFQGKYVGNNIWQHDTIEIIFNYTNSDCKSVYTVKGFAKPYNHVTGTNACNSIANTTHEMIGNIITICNAKIVDNVWSNNGITNDNDISFYTLNCNNNQINFKKIN